MFCIMLSSLKSQKYACAVMRPFSQSNLTHKTSSQIEHTHLWNRDFKCHVNTLKFETPTSHSVCFSPVWPSHLGPCPFSPWKWHFIFSPPENGILFFLPLEMAFYLWRPLVLMNNHLNISIIFGLYQRLVCPSCNWWWHLFLLTYYDTFYPCLLIVPCGRGAL